MISFFPSIWSIQSAGRGKEWPTRLAQDLEGAETVGFLMEDGQIAADRTEDSTPDSRQIAAAGGSSRPSSSSFGLCRRAFRRLGLQTGLCTTSVITKRWGLMFVPLHFVSCE